MNTRLLPFLAFLAFTTSMAGEEMTKERILELGKLPDDRSVIPKAFKDWSNAEEYEVRITSVDAEGKKHESPLIKVPEKIAMGKYLVNRFTPPESPLQFTIITWYEKDTNTYHKAVHVDTPDGSKIHRIVGTRLPKTNSYAYSSVGDGKTSLVTIEHQSPEKAHWRTTHFNADGKILGAEYGQAIPSKRPGKRKK